MTNVQQTILATAQRMDPWVNRELWHGGVLVLRFHDGSNVTVSPAGAVTKLKRIQIAQDA